MIKSNQILAYDAASRIVRSAVDVLETVNVARLNADDVAKVSALLKSARELGHELFSAGHSAFVRERMGE